MLLTFSSLASCGEVESIVIFIKLPLHLFLLFSVLSFLGCVEISQFYLPRIDMVVDSIELVLRAECLHEEALSG